MVRRQAAYTAAGQLLRKQALNAIMIKAKLFRLSLGGCSDSGGSALASAAACRLCVLGKVEGLGVFGLTAWGFLCRDATLCCAWLLGFDLHFSGRVGKHTVHTWHSILPGKASCMVIVLH